jgi:hypothetical protein
MSEERRPFSVTDRRQFTPDGELRPAEPAPEAAEPAGEEGSEQEPTGEGGAPRTPEDFAGLVAALGVQGLATLGALASGAADLREARATISLLESLQVKSEGHRTPDEDRLLASVLYELRMAYVARARSTGT